MGRSIHSLVPSRPAQGNPPSGRLDFPLVTQESQGGAKSLARETTGGTRAAPGMFPCTGLRELVLPERALLQCIVHLSRILKKGAKPSHTRRNGHSGLATVLLSSGSAVCLVANPRGRKAAGI